MNKRQIQRVLKTVFEDWLQSIDDINVKNRVMHNAIISGGSIASMLLGEKVNDFDFYFTDFETTQAVAEYYIKKFTELNPNVRIQPKLHKKELLNKRVKIVMKSIGFCSEKADAGYQYFEELPDEEGVEFLNNTFNNPVQDDEDGEDEDADTPGNLSEVDVEHDGTTRGVTTAIITGLDEVDSDALEKSEPNAPKPKYRPIFMSSNAITLANNVQLVMRFYGTPEEIHANYDFAHCTNYWTSKDKTLVLNQPALESLMSRELDYRGSKYPLCSIIRTRKFIRRGWKINAGQYLKMCFQISELDLKNPAVLEDQLTGVDTAYFIQLINRIKHDTKVDPKQEINSIYIVSLIDRMF